MSAMSQKRGRLWSRGGAVWFFPACMVLYVVGTLTFGIFMLQTRSDAIVLAFAVVSAPFALLLAWVHARQH